MDFKMKSQDDFPCETCIVLAMCKARVQHLKFVFDASSVLAHMYGECSILSDHIKKITSHIFMYSTLKGYYLTPVGKKMCEFFNLTPSEHNIDQVEKRYE